MRTLQTPTDMVINQLNKLQFGAKSCYFKNHQFHIKVQNSLKPA